MAEKNTYFIYGDDDRVQGENLDELAAKVDNLMGIRKERILKERKKNKKKPKKRIRNENFVSHVTAELRDVEAEEEGSTIRGAMDDPFLHDVDQYNEEDYEEPKKRKTRDLNIEWKPWYTIVAVVLGLLLLALLYGLLAPKLGLPTIGFGGGGDKPAATSADPDKTADTTDYSVYVSEGMLEDIDISKEYSLEEAVGYAKNINDITTAYLDEMITVINNRKEDDSVNVEQELAVNKAKIEVDTSRLYAYENVFLSHHGAAYIKAAQTRMENIRSMYGSVKNSMTLEELVETVNGYIQTENQLSETSKTELMDFLNFNKVEYELIGDEIKYDSAQFKTEEPAEGEEGTEEAAATEEVDPNEAAFISFERRGDDYVESGKIHLSEADRGVTEYQYLALLDSDEDAQKRANELNDKLIKANNTALSYAEGSKLKYETEFGFIETFEQFLGLENMVNIPELKALMEENGFTCKYTN